MLAQKVVELNNITINYGNVKIIDNISLDIKKGEFVSVIGPNGAGKSTILKAITRSIEINNGYIYLNGKDINSFLHKERAKIIGFVPQEYNIPFNFTVQDIVSMGRNPYMKRMHKEKGEDKKIVENSLRKTNTLQFRNKSFNNLSGGEKQRVVTARALAQEPEILILDEATSNLDIHHQLELLELIYWLNRENGLTVLAVMHDLNLASRFSDRLILLNKGQIFKEGKPKEVLTEKVLSKVYDMEMVVRDNKLLSFKEIVPLRVRRACKGKNVNVHVMCGGGTGEYIIEKLYSQRYNISCGIINEGDSDLELCKSLNIDYISESPFTEFSAESIKKNKEYIKRADIIILTDVPVGWGNLANIKQLEEVKDKEIIILHTINRDYVDGECDKIIDKLKQKENVFYAMNLKKVFEKLNSKIYNKRG